MSKKAQQKISLFKTCNICILVVFKPTLLKEIDIQNNENLEATQPESESGLQTVHRAFWSSLRLILLFGMIGVCAGGLLKCLIGNPSKSMITLIQVLGALLLLWGTLFIRGFEIQSFGGLTHCERVNQWIYRTLYCVGTAVIVCSVIWERI